MACSSVNKSCSFIAIEVAKVEALEDTEGT